MERGPATSDLHGSRTLAAIVFTDGVGFTTLMAENEAHTLDLIRRDFKLMKEFCQRFEGQVIKTTGDGLLMYFISAVQAVACAQEIQRALADIGKQLQPEDILFHRIGIHLGEVFLSRTDVMGSGVNIAARLQAEAEPGGICISQVVYDIVKSHLALQAICLGSRPLKNIRESICIYQVLLTPMTRANQGTIPGPQAIARLEVDYRGESYREYQLNRDLFTIGRAADNNLVLAESFVSRYHAQVVRQGNQYLLIDLDSMDGTRVNAVRLSAKAPHPLRNGDILTIGTTEIRFCDTVTHLIKAAKLLLPDPQGDQEYWLEQELTTIGRAPNNHLILSERFVSRHHAQLIRDQDRFSLVDLDSTSGTWVNQISLQPHQPHSLYSGDVIRIGTKELHFLIDIAPPVLAQAPGIGNHRPAASESTSGPSTGGLSFN